MARYGNFVQSTYRNNFARPVNFLGINLELVRDNISRDLVLAFDPSFLPKSGKCTDGTGRCWSGCAGKAKKGTEFSGIAAIDLEDKTALHLLAVQTVERHKGETLLDYYASILTINREERSEVSPDVVAGAYFSRKPFVDQLLVSNFHLVSRLRTNVHLRYLYAGPKENHPGAPPSSMAGLIPVICGTIFYAMLPGS
jgi:hypothetical protein